MYQQHMQGGFPPQRQGSHAGPPPPVKIIKGNTVITKYPPPPGYMGPAQPHQPFVQQPQRFPHQLPAPVGPMHAMPMARPQGPLPGLGVPQRQFQAPPQRQQGWHTPAVPQVAPPPPRQRIEIREEYTYMYCVPFLNEDAEKTPFDNFHGTFGEDLESAFDGEHSFASCPEEIDQNLSLGTIEWKAPLPTRRAIPATFADAEFEACNPRVFHPNDDTCVSDLFAQSKRSEALISVRLTESWNGMKDDLIFKEFEAKASPINIISREDMLAIYQIRIDEDFANGEYMSSRETTPSTTPDRPGDDYSALNALEQALQTNSRHSSVHSRNSSVSSHHTAEHTRPKRLPLVRDRQQEDILAALGVTGSPKVVYQTPGPAFGPPPNASFTQSGTNTKSHSLSSAQGTVTNPSQLQEGRNNSTSSQFQQKHGAQDQRTSSNSRNSSEANGFDNDPEPDNDATPRPKHQRSDNRKRSYADAQAGAANDPTAEDDEPTPKQRKTQTRVDSAHQRFW